MNLTASPVTAVLRGTDYSISPLTISDYGELNAFIRGNFIRSVTLGLKEVEDVEIRNETREHAFRYSQTIEFDSEEGQKLLTQTPEGMARLLFQSLAKTGGLAYDKCLRLLSDEESVESFWNAFVLVNDLSGGSSEPGDTDQKKSGQTK